VEVLELCFGERFLFEPIDDHETGGRSFKSLWATDRFPGLGEVRQLIYSLVPSEPSASSRAVTGPRLTGRSDPPGQPSGVRPF